MTVSNDERRFQISLRESNRFRVTGGGLEVRHDLIDEFPSDGAALGLMMRVGLDGTPKTMKDLVKMSPRDSVASIRKSLAMLVSDGYVDHC